MSGIRLEQVTVSVPTQDGERRILHEMVATHLGLGRPTVRRLDELTAQQSER